MVHWFNFNLTNSVNSYILRCKIIVFIGLTPGIIMLTKTIFPRLTFDFEVFALCIIQLWNKISILKFLMDILILNLILRCFFHLFLIHLTFFWLKSRHLSWTTVWTQPTTTYVLYFLQTQGNRTVFMTLRHAFRYDFKNS